MRAGMILPFSLMKSLRISISLESIHSIFSAVKRQNLRRLNSWRPPFLSSFLSPRPLPLPLAPLLGGGMSNSFYEFNVGCVQYQLLAVAALAGEESGDFHLHSRPGCRHQTRFALEGQTGHLALHRALGAGFDLLGSVAEPEIDHRNTGRRVAQRVEFDQFAGQHELVVQYAQAAAGAATAGAAGAAAAATAASAGLGASAAFGASPFSTERDFSSFIIGEGAVTAAFICTVRWRRTASLNLNECSSSSRVS